MKILYPLIFLLFVPLALADHFTGTYQSQNGITLMIQHEVSGQMQGFISSNGQQFQLQGYGNEQGAQGQISSSQGMMMFQAQVSQDLKTLQMTIAQVDAKGQALPNTIQQLSFQRVHNPPGPTPIPPPRPVNPNPAPGPIPVNPGPTPVPTPNPGSTNPLNPLPVPTPMPGRADVWPGVYQGQGLVMIVQGSNGNYSGVFEVNGQRIPFSAQGDMSYLQGAMQSANGTTAFALGLDGNTAYVYVADTEYILVKQPNSGPVPNNNPLGN